MAFPVAGTCTTAHRDTGGPWATAAEWNPSDLHWICNLATNKLQFAANLLLLHAFACFLILSTCYQLQVIKGKEKKKEKKLYPCSLSPGHCSVSYMVGSCGKGETWSIFLLPKKLLSHIQITSYLLCSSKTKRFGTKMQLNTILCNSKDSTDVLIKILRKFK